MVVGVEVLVVVVQRATNGMGVMVVGTTTPTQHRRNTDATRQSHNNDKLLKMKHNDSQTNNNDSHNDDKAESLEVPSRGCG